MSALATRFSTATTKFQVGMAACAVAAAATLDRKSTRLNSSHSQISYAVFCLKKKNHHRNRVGDALLAGVHLHRSADIRHSAIDIAYPVLAGVNILVAQAPATLPPDLAPHTV